jgi:hypothetical protein
MKNGVLPEELIEEVKSFNCVLFAGAGTTTEQPYFRETFLGNIKEKCKYPKKSEKQSFPEVMQYYCQKVDGGRKNKLIREIIEWIEFYSAEGEPNRVATGFFREIARIPFFRIIVTTNWDPFCERTTNVLVPMVEDKDIPFWDENKRQVLKIHGCVTRPHTIVATLDDYDMCMKDKSRGAIFTKLRDLMATKIFIFVGYSIKDPDFKLIYDEVISNLGPFRRGAYVVDPKPTEDSIKDWEIRGIKTLKISGLVFAWELIKRLEKDKIIPSKELISYFEKQLYRIIDIHMHTSDKQELVGAFSSAMYQDGLIHSLEYLIENSRTGKLMRDFIEELADYQKTLDKCYRAVTRYEKKPKTDKPNFAIIEVAYWSGRVEALRRFISNNKRDIPAFFSPYVLKPRSKMAGLKMFSPI